MYKLDSVAIFKTLAPEKRTFLERKIHIKHYTQDSIVFYEGDESRCLYILLEGTMKLFTSGLYGSILKLPNLLLYMLTLNINRFLLRVSL